LRISGDDPWFGVKEELNILFADILEDVVVEVESVVAVVAADEEELVEVVTPRLIWTQKSKPVSKVHEDADPATGF
jgi:hypothetical protein